MELEGAESADAVVLRGESCLATEMGIAGDGRDSTENRAVGAEAGAVRTARTMVGAWGHGPVAVGLRNNLHMIRTRYWGQLGLLKLTCSRLIERVERTR